MGSRMFVGIVPPPAVVEDLDGFLESRRGADARLRWSDPEQWHVTLAFLRDVPDRSYDRLLEGLGEIAARTPRFDIQVAGAGCFPEPYAARVLFAHVTTPAGPVLQRLSRDARAAASRAGAPPDGATFAGHLTLARTRQPIEATRWLRVVDAWEGADWEVCDLHLIESHLGEGRNGRPRYETRESFPLTGRDANRAG